MKGDNENEKLLITIILASICAFSVGCSETSAELPTTIIVTPSEEPADNNDVIDDVVDGLTDDNTNIKDPNRAWMLATYKYNNITNNPDFERYTKYDYEIYRVDFIHGCNASGWSKELKVRRSVDTGAYDISYENFIELFTCDDPDINIIEPLDPEMDTDWIHATYIRDYIAYKIPRVTFYYYPQSDSFEKFVFYKTQPIYGNHEYVVTYDTFLEEMMPYRIN